MKTIGKFVQTWRLAQDPPMSVPEMARRAGINYQNIQNLEDDKVERPRFLPELAKVMGITVDELLARRISAGHVNVDTQAQSLSHSIAEDALTAAEVGGGQPPVSFDAEFEKMSTTEKRRFLFLWAAALDHPPDPMAHLGGIPTWIKSKTASAAQSKAMVGPGGLPSKKVSKTRRAK